MNFDELSKLMYDLNIPSRFYRLDGTHYELAEVICRRDDRWVMFLSERGSEYDRVEFADEHLACIHFLGRVVRSLAESNLIAIKSD